MLLLAALLLGQGDLLAAEDALGRGDVATASALYERALADAGEDARSSARALLGLGECRRQVGNCQQALVLHGRALAAAPRDDAALLAVIHSASARDHEALGHYDLALSEEALALELRRQSTEAAPIARSHEDLARYHVARGEHASAILELNQAVKLREPLGNPRALAAALHQLAESRAALGQHGLAVVTEQRALALLEPLGNPAEIGASLARLADSYRALGDEEQAIAQETRVLDLNEASGDRAATAATLERLARDHDRVGRASRALDFAARAAALRDQVDEPHALARALAELGERQAAAGQHDRALETFDRSVRQVDRIATGWLTGEGRQLFFDGWSNLRHAVAASTCAADRARVPGAIARGLPLIAFLAGPLPPPRARGKETIEPPLAPDWFAHLAERLDADEVLLAYLAGAPSYLFAITRDAAQLHELPDIERLDEEVQALTALASTRGSSMPAIARAAHDLYVELVQPARSLIERKHAVVIVAEGGLERLPFEMLLVREAQDSELADPTRLPYLVRETAVRYATAIEVRERADVGGKQAGSPGRPAVQVLAGPVHAEPGGDARWFARDARREVREIAAALLGDQQRTRKDLDRIAACSSWISEHLRIEQDGDARLSEIREASERIQVLHIAAARFLDERAPWYSGLVLSPEIDDPSTGFVGALRIARLRLRCNLVFLSASATMCGETRSRRGAPSLARAFLDAGARAVIGTHWAIDDEAAAALAGAFYRHLIGGASVAESLRLAKLELLASASLAHPFFWASFVISGSV